MASNISEAPDLASVLKILAGLSQTQQPQDRAIAQSQTQPFAAPSKPQSVQQTWQGPNHQSPPLAPSEQPVKGVDPATIIEWSAGLRCVMKTVAKHDSVLHEIRRMIKVQHEHEEQWWKSREALIERQRVRKEGQKKLDDVLKAIGGSASNGNSNTSPEELTRELETFDMKVYKAQMQMVRGMNAKFRALGVPFFGTKVELVRSTGEEDSTGGVGVHKDEKGMIDEAELVKLQRKLLTILEDLCSE